MKLFNKNPGFLKTTNHTPKGWKLVTCDLRTTKPRIVLAQEQKQRKRTSSSTNKKRAKVLNTHASTHTHARVKTRTLSDKHHPETQKAQKTNALNPKLRKAKCLRGWVHVRGGAESAPPRSWGFQGQRSGEPIYPKPNAKNPT